MMPGSHWRWPVELRPAEERIDDLERLLKRLRLDERVGVYAPVSRAP